MSEMTSIQVLVEDELYTLEVTAEEAVRAQTDQNLLLQLVQQVQEGRSQALINQLSQEGNKSPENEKIIEEGASIDDPALEECDSAITKGYTWPDAAVLLLLVLYKGKQEEFSSGKRNNKIWNEIASEIKDQNAKFVVTGQQCGVKISGLKRTYKNIKDSNKKSGNSRTTWAFYPLMESIFGEKKWVEPPAEASSSGPSQAPPPSEPNSPNCPTPDGSKAKRKRVDAMMSDFLSDMRESKGERERQRAIRNEERKKEREQHHSEKMAVKSTY